MESLSIAQAIVSVLIEAEEIVLTDLYFSKKYPSIYSTKSVLFWFEASMIRLIFKASTGSISGSLMMSSKCH